MQNLPIITAAPTPVQATQPASASADSSAQPSESFGNVLARQRADNKAQAENKQQASKSSAGTTASDSSTTVKGNDPQTAAQPTSSTTLPAEMLAALLPATPLGGTGKDKTDPKLTTTDASSTLPSDMLAMLLPANLAQPRMTNEKSQPDSAGGLGRSPVDVGSLQESLAGSLSSAAGKDKSLADSLTHGRKSTSFATEMGDANSSAGSKLSTAIPVASTDAASLRAQANLAIAEPGANNVLTEVFGKSGKTGELIALSDVSASKALAQAPVPSDFANLNQNSIAPLAASQSGVAEAVTSVINTPVTDSAWGNEFNQKITWMASQHEQTAELHLNPPNLGPLDVVLKVNGDQATAMFTSPHAAVREAVEQALPKLRDMLADNGIMLGNAMVNDQSPKDQQQAWQGDSRQQGRAGGVMGESSVISGIMPAGVTIAPSRLHQGMLDTFA